MIPLGTGRVGERFPGMSSPLVDFGIVSIVVRHKKGKRSMDISERDEYWYNTFTGEVEHGPQSLAVDRIGPFASAEEAARALDIVRERSEKWAEEDAEDDR